MRTRKILIIFSMIVLLFINNSNIKCYANESNNKIINKYKTTKNAETEFLNDIHKMETDNLKIINIKKDEALENSITKEIIESKEIKSQDKNNINQTFGETRIFNDGEWQGKLPITDIKVKTINNGYYEKIDEKILNFTNYSNNDLNSIEKEITLNNKIYYLINVEWEVDQIENIDGENIPLTYKGNKIYQTVLKIENPNTYEVTVTYAGIVKKINTIYDYTITFENKVEEIKQEERKEQPIVPIIIISGIGLAVLLVCIFNLKNTYIYSKTNKGFKLIKKERISDKKVLINITSCNNKSPENIYAIKINKVTFNKLKGRTITITLGNRKKDLIIWNNYYEIKI